MTERITLSSAFSARHAKGFPNGRQPRILRSCKSFFEEWLVAKDVALSIGLYLHVLLLGARGRSILVKKVEISSVLQMLQFSNKH